MIEVAYEKNITKFMDISFSKCFQIVMEILKKVKQ